MAHVWYWGTNIGNLWRPLVSVQKYHLINNDLPFIYIKIWIRGVLFFRLSAAVRVVIKYHESHFKGTNTHHRLYTKLRGVQLVVAHVVQTLVMITGHGTWPVRYLVRVSVGECVMAWIICSQSLAFQICPCTLEATLDVLFYGPVMNKTSHVRLTIFDLLIRLVNNFRKKERKQTYNPKDPCKLVLGLALPTNHVVKTRSGYYIFHCALQEINSKLDFGMLWIDILTRIERNFCLSEANPISCISLIRLPWGRGMSSIVWFLWELEPAW